MKLEVIKLEVQISFSGFYTYIQLFLCFYRVCFAAIQHFKKSQCGFSNARTGYTFTHSHHSPLNKGIGTRRKICIFYTNYQMSVNQLQLSNFKSIGCEIRKLLSIALHRSGIVTSLFLGRST